MGHVVSVAAYSAALARRDRAYFFCKLYLHNIQSVPKLAAKLIRLVQSDNIYILYIVKPNYEQNGRSQQDKEDRIYNVNDDWSELTSNLVKTMFLNTVFTAFPKISKGLRNHLSRNSSKPLRNRASKASNFFTGLPRKTNSREST